MLDLTITIHLYQKSYINAVIEALKQYSIDNPIYIIELPQLFTIKFETDYHQWELKKEIENLFDGYSYTENIGNDTDLALKFQIHQSSMSTDNWGRGLNEDSINSTYFLVKNRIEDQHIIPNQTINVLFGSDMREYHIYLAEVSFKNTDEKRYTILKSGQTNLNQKERLSSKNFNTPIEAFWEGYRLLEPIIQEEYIEYKKLLKSNRRKTKKHR